jgi:hypothetical protein
VPDQQTLFWVLPVGLAGFVLEHNQRYSAWVRELHDVGQTTRGYSAGGLGYGSSVYNIFNTKWAAGRTDGQRTYEGQDWGYIPPNVYHALPSEEVD